ncbi:MAG: hypothetical protein ACRDPY_15170 [Streptosporangiaceae bacterium]
MTWLATSPYGQQLNVSWTCEECPVRCEGITVDADPDTIRAEAVAHLAAAGHRVLISRGTVETLYPMATTAEVPSG